MMKRLLLLIVIFLLSLPALAQDTTPEFIRVRFADVEFSLPAILLTGIEMQILPEQLYQADAPPWSAYPETLEITLGDYSDDTDFFHIPQIRIYKLEGDMSRFGGVDSGFTGRLNGVRTFFNENADLESYIGNQGEYLPMLAISGAAQIFRAKPQYIRSDQVVGVRYITMYAQDSFPIVDTAIFYTFQGFSMDGQYYISMILPLSSGQLPDPDDDFDFDAFYADPVAAIGETTLMLNEWDDDVFMPSVTMLDEIVLSVQIFLAEE